MAIAGSSAWMQAQVIQAKAVRAPLRRWRLFLALIAVPFFIASVLLALPVLLHFPLRATPDWFASDLFTAGTALSPALLLGFFVLYIPWVLAVWLQQDRAVPVWHVRLRRFLRVVAVFILLTLPYWLLAPLASAAIHADNGSIPFFSVLGALISLFLLFRCAPGIDTATLPQGWRMTGPQKWVCLWLTIDLALVAAIVIGAMAFCGELLARSQWRVGGTADTLAPPFLRMLQFDVMLPVLGGLIMVIIAADAVRLVARRSKT